MARIVPRRFQRVQLPALRPGQPVSGTWGQTIADQLAFLVGRVTHSCCTLYSSAKVNGDVYSGYIRSPAARVLLVVVELYEATAVTDRITCNVTITGATVIGSSVLDGSSVLVPPTASTRRPTTWAKLFDVSGLTIGSLAEIKVTTAVSTGTPKGVSMVSAYEIPRDMLDGESAPSTDEGISAAWPFQGNQIYAGSASTTADAATGTQRIVDQVDTARAYFRPQIINTATVEATASCWVHTTAADAFSAFKFNFAQQPRFYFRVRRLYTASASSPLANYKMRVRYNTNGFSPTFRLITAGAINNDVTLTNSAGAWATATGAVTIETNSTDQELYCTFEIDPNTAGAVSTYISAVTVYCEET